MMCENMVSSRSGARRGEEETGGAGLAWPASLCTLVFQLKMLLSSAHLTPPFKVHVKVKLSLEAFFDPLPGHNLLRTY